MVEYSNASNCSSSSGLVLKSLLFLEGLSAALFTYYVFSMSFGLFSFSLFSSLVFLRFF